MRILTGDAAVSCILEPRNGLVENDMAQTPIQIRVKFESKLKLN